LGAADAVPVAAESTRLADRVPDGVRRRGRRGARGRGPVLTVEPERRAVALLVPGQRRRGRGHLLSPLTGFPQGQKRGGPAGGRGERTRGQRERTIDRFTGCLPGCARPTSAGRSVPGRTRPRPCVGPG